MPTWKITREDVEPEFIEAEDLTIATSLALENGEFLSVAREESTTEGIIALPRIQSPDGHEHGRI